VRLSDAVIGNFVQVEMATIFELGLVAELSH